MYAMTAAEIKRVRSLSEKKFRDETGLFVLEGEKLVSELLDSGFTVEAVYRRSEIGENTMSRISSLHSPSPVLAVARKPSDRLPSIPGPGLYLALDGISDPGNLGTIMRIADWFGIDGIYASRGTTDLYSPKVVQATMGAILRVKFMYTDIPSLCEGVIKAGGKVYGTFLDGENMFGKDLSTGGEYPVVIVIGNEAHGISKETAAHVSDRLLIPSYPAEVRSSESLNAAVATAITVAEFRRPFAVQSR